LLTRIVNFTDLPITASTIGDFYTRLNNLRHLEDGTTNVSFTAPSSGTKIIPMHISQVQTEIANTKTALNFL